MLKWTNSAGRGIFLHGDRLPWGNIYLKKMFPDKYDLNSEWPAEAYTLRHI